MRTSLTWRAAQAWLRGYSDAKAGRPCEVPQLWSDYLDDYRRGYAVANERGGEPALDSRGIGACPA